MYKYILGVGAILLLIFGQCNGCRESPCTEGYEEQGDQCECPSEKFEVKGTCRELKSNEYFGASSNCVCEDSTFFEVGPKIYNEPTNQTTIEITKHVFGEKSVNIVYNTHSYEYVKLSSGKELLIGLSYSWDPCYFPPADVKYNRGEIFSSDSIRLLFIGERGFGPNLTIDTCIWNLHK